MKNIKSYKLFLESLLNDKTPTKPDPKIIEDEDGLIGRDAWFDEAIKLIRRDCKPFVEELDKEFKNDPVLFKENVNLIPAVWRGIQKIWDADKMLPELQGSFVSGLRGSNIRHNIAYKEVRKDREPRDMAHGVSWAFDEEFDNKFGISPRIEGVFTTGKRNTADSYGYAYLIFPIGNYKYVWSPDIKDLFNDVEKKYWYHYLDFPEGAVDDIREQGENGRDLQEEYGIDWYKEEMKESEIDNHLSQDAENNVKSIVGGYKDTDLAKAIRSEHEITFVCDSYYIVSYNHKFLKEFYHGI